MVGLKVVTDEPQIMKIEYAHGPEYGGPAVSI